MQYLPLLRKIARGEPLESTMAQLARMHEEQVPGQRSTVMRIDGGGRRLHFLAAPSMPAIWMETLEGVAVGPAGNCPTAAWSGKTVVCADVASDPLWERLRDFALAHGVRAVWSIPILADSGELLGVFGCCVGVAREPTPEELELAGEAAQVAAAAIERQRSVEVDETRLRLAVQAANVGFWEWEVGTGLVFFSPEWKRQLGYAEHELKDEFETWSNRVHPDDLGPVMERVRRYVEHPSAGFESEVRMRHRDGSWRWIYSSASMLFEAEGKPQRMLGCHIDVTERRLQEDQIRDHALRLQQSSRRLLEVEAAERRKFSRELHDRVGQNLSSLLMNLNVLRSLLVAPQPQSVLRRLDDTERVLEQTVTEVRGVLQDLRPAELDDFGLLRALAFHAESLGVRAGFTVGSHDLSACVSLPMGAETELYRIGLEALTNVAKHAGATHVDVIVESCPGNVVLRIEDNGRGLGDGGVQPARGRGLRGMRERAEALGATVELQPRPDGGTRLSVQVPTGADVGGVS
ncbi:MAG: hypothetical protein RLZZ200_550 [Pseudomonadota bacterium]